MSKYIVNTNTGLIFEKKPLMDMKAYMEPYQPSKEEIRIGRKIDKAPKVKAHEEAEEPEAGTPVVEVEVETMAPAEEKEVDLGDGDADAVETKATAPQKEVVKLAQDGMTAPEKKKAAPRKKGASGKRKKAKAKK